MIYKKTQYGKSKNFQYPTKDWRLEKNGETNPFEFNDINQQDNEINLKEFLVLAEKIRRNFIEHLYSIL